MSMNLPLGVPSTATCKSLSHYRPYSDALKGVPLLQPKFSSDSTPKPNQSATYSSAPPPPFMCNSTLSQSNGSDPVPSPPKVPALINQNDCFRNHHYHTLQFNSGAPSSYQHVGVHLQQVNSELLHKVNHLTEHLRHWETWYMTVRHELEASNDARARASHWKAQAQEMQRQKAVLTARLRRWQRWVKAYEKSKSENSLDDSSSKPTSAEHDEETTISQSLKASEGTTECPPLPFKKRYFSAGSSTKIESSSNPFVSTSDVQKSPRPIMKVGTALEGRCLTPNEDDSTSANPITPSL